MTKYLAEFFGTFVLVFGGCGAAVLAGDRIGYVGIALAFGLSLLAMQYAIGHISGCHINSAVTFGMLLSGRMRGRDAVGYWIAQIAGAIVAAAVLLLVAQGIQGGYSAAAQGLASNGYGEHSPAHYGLGAAFIIEVVLTFFLVFTVLGSTDPASPVGFAGLAIGLVLTLIHLVGIPVTNMSVNPARSIGPALFAGGWALHQLWLFIVAPLIGAAVASAVYRGLGRTTPVPQDATERPRTRTAGSGAQAESR
ncbi:MAG: aquaporin Z [Acidobacteriota bacterium]